MEKSVDITRTMGPGYEGVAARAFRVLFANEPRSYREAIADVVCALGPPAAVFLAEPQDLDRAVRRLAPHLIVCSRISNAPEGHAATASWVELYAGHGSRSRVRFLGEAERIVERMELAGLLAIVGQAGRLAGA